MSKFNSGTARRIVTMQKFMWVVASVLFVAMAFSPAAQAAQPGDHFKALGPDKAQGRDDSLFFPNDFEAAVASHPDPNALTFFSLCRRAPFTSTSLFSAFTAANTDTIVNDELFTLVDGTQCYQPKNEQNIVINPTNSQNIVTSANDYRAPNIVIAVSHAYGVTWSDPTQVTNAAHPSDTGTAPAVAPDGTIYVAYEGNQANNMSPDQIVLARSTDGGRTFTNTQLGR